MFPLESANRSSMLACHVFMGRAVLDVGDQKIQGCPGENLHGYLHRCWFAWN